MAVTNKMADLFFLNVMENSFRTRRFLKICVIFGVIDTFIQ
jgi:hypothetical protein